MARQTIADYLACCPDWLVSLYDAASIDCPVCGCRASLHFALAKNGALAVHCDGRIPMHNDAKDPDKVTGYHPCVDFQDEAPAEEEAQP